MSSSGKNTALCRTLLQPEVRGAVVQPVSGGHGGQRGVQRAAGELDHVEDGLVEADNRADERVGT